MAQILSRRGLLGGGVAAFLAGLITGDRGHVAAEAAARLNMGPPEPFSWSALIDEARSRAGRPYTPPYRPAPDVVYRIDYTEHGRIRFRPDDALFRDGPQAFPVAFFPLGRLFPKSVVMHVLSPDATQAQEIFYAPTYFDMPEDSPARGLPRDAGFAGFQIKAGKSQADWTNRDWAAFLGASYFRSVGALGEYGLSARGIAVDVATDHAEEFPDFVGFWLQGAPNEQAPFVVYALLDGPSITGAYRFSIRRTEGVVMDVECNLFLRTSVERLGMAPLTSMYWYGEFDKPGQIDWRPEVHDSDGLSMWTGAGERIWRPLVNPPRVQVNAFADDNPRGFGLMQRDRAPQNYLDRVHYERRPSLWVEPIGGWGEGAVQLVEIPTDAEIHDNIVAMWVPKRPAEAGQAHDLRYRLHWLADEPHPPTDLARVVSTRIGRGGEPGGPPPDDTWRFVVTAAGPVLEALTSREGVEAVVTTSRGRITVVRAEPVPSSPRWRMLFDLEVTGTDPVDLRAFMRIGDRSLTETWLFQYHPKTDI